MTEASQFYEAAASGLGSDFLDDVQRGIDKPSGTSKSWSIDWSRPQKTASAQVSL